MPILGSLPLRFATRGARHWWATVAFGGEPHRRVCDRRLCKDDCAGRFEQQRSSQLPSLRRELLAKNPGAKLSLRTASFRALVLVLVGQASINQDRTASSSDRMGSSSSHPPASPPTSIPPAASALTALLSPIIAPSCSPLPLLLPSLPLTAISALPCPRRSLPARPRTSPPPSPPTHAFLPPAHRPPCSFPALRRPGPVRPALHRLAQHRSVSLSVPPRSMPTSPLPGGTLRTHHNRTSCLSPALPPCALAQSSPGARNAQDTDGYALCSLFTPASKSVIPASRPLTPSSIDGFPPTPMRSMVVRACFP